MARPRSSLALSALLCLALAAISCALPTNNVNIVSRGTAASKTVNPTSGLSALRRVPVEQTSMLPLRGGAAKSTLESFINFCDVQHLPIGIMVAIIVGLNQPDAGVHAGDNKFIAKWSIPLIFFINGVKIKTQEAKKAVSNVKALAWGSVCILFLSAYIGCTLSKVAPLGVKEFLTGIAVFSCLPSTTVSSPMLAAKAGGSFALALLLTLLVNVIAIFTTPFLLSQLAGISGDGFSVPDMIKRLATNSLFPLILGKAVISASPLAADLSHRFSKLLTYISSAVIIFQPWVTISRSTKKGVFDRVKGMDVVLLTAIVTLMHLGWQAMEYAGCQVLGLSVESTKSVCIVGGAKNLPLALTLTGLLPKSVGDTGLLTLPIILGHFSTIVCDSILGSIWK